MNKTLIIILFLVSNTLIAQVGIGTSSPDVSSQLEINSSSKGVLIPRVFLNSVTNATSPINSPTESLLVYNTNASVTNGYGKGYYYFNGTLWEKLIINSNTVSSINLWSAKQYVMYNTDGQDLSDIDDAIEPGVYNATGKIEVKLVIRYSSSTASATHFQLRAHDGTNETYPIVHSDSWSFAGTQTGGVATSPWKAWNAGTNAHEIHLHGWVDNNSITIQNVTLLIRSQ